MASFPAGDESDASNDEWDIGGSDKTPSSTQNVDAFVPWAEDNVSLLKRAIKEGNIEMVENLLDNGMDVEMRLSFGWTPLMCAVDVANYDLAKVLLDRGANASFSKDHWTVLMAGCMASASEDKITRCVELLLSRNADPNIVSRNQMSCLMLAAREGHSKLINLLVSHRAEINIQDVNGYTALSIAVQYGREEAVLKLLQLGADKSIRTQVGKSPADLAWTFKHTQISSILASAANVSPDEAFSSVEETLSKFFKGSVSKLDDVELFLHGLGLGYLAEIMNENDITWSYLLTMDREDLEKAGVTDPADQQKVLGAVQQIQQDNVDLDTISQLGVADSGSEELHNYLISVLQQCCYLTESIQDVNRRFPRQASQLVYPLDTNKELQTICNQLVVQTKDLQKEVNCLRSLLRQLDEATDRCRLPQLSSRGERRTGPLTRVALGTLGATFLFLLYKAAGRLVLTARSS